MNILSPHSALLSGRPVAALFGVALLVTGCANPDGVTTGSLPDDYRTRHPITIGEAEKVIDIPIAAGDHGLTTGQREVIAGFAQEYLRASEGIIRIQTPQGALNSGAAAYAAGDIRRLLVRMGVPKNRILQTGFAADGYGASAPVRLSFVAITAQTAPCGEWPADMTLNTVENKNYYNFGCASQRNLAAQIANPNDLLGPRRMTPPDAEQRGQAMQRYRESYTELKDME
ncbi:pilus assembly protein [Pseudorhizobium endolithicum]|uniref:Pilus assembly protein n=1 Tax=Pseudorhizobium endolithicum TaxID=1191678 RepID=A0ABN7JLS5_9HYPH|nr:pilus assembly protein [Pseudorhizobium endolithicum]